MKYKLYSENFNAKPPFPFMVTKNGFSGVTVIDFVVNDRFVLPSEI
jgi:hypothetical protein